MGGKRVIDACRGQPLIFFMIPTPPYTMPISIPIVAGVITGIITERHFDLLSVCLGKQTKARCVSDS